MNVLHVIPSIAATQGGPSVAIKTIARTLIGHGVKVTVATTDDNGPSLRLAVPLETAVSEGDTTYLYFKRDLSPYKISLGLAKWLHWNVRRFDLVHIHALFSFSSTVAARIARKKGVPYIVRPLGVLNRWGMRNRRRVPKAISFRLVELPILLGAASIHYTSDEERKQAGELDPKLAEHESVVIPLPVTQQGPGSREQFLARFPHARGKRMILFLSRIDPMKGLETLLDAFARVRDANNDVALVIAGEGDKGYVRKLKEQASSMEHRARSSRLRAEATARQEKQGITDDSVVSGPWSSGLSDDVIWTGHLSGEMKAAALAAADVFVLPSASENFGIAVAESLAAGVPTIVSEEVALSSDIRHYDGGLVVKRDVQQLAGAITELLANRGRASTLAENGRRLVRERYSPEAVGKALHELYQGIISNRDKGEGRTEKGERKG